MVPSATAQASPSLADRIQKIIDRPEFDHANFGIEFYSPETGKAVYSLNSQKLFVPASTTKLLTEGAVLASLGPGYRFHTRVYRTGPVDMKGRLNGDIVLVASGDPNLSNRIQSDGTLAFFGNDHSNSGSALPGDPLAVVHEIARAIAAKGIRRVAGKVMVDASLFPETPWLGEGVVGLMISPISVNDNQIDLVMMPGARVGDPAIASSSPRTSYIQFINHLTTSSAGTSANLDEPQIRANSDGTVTVTLTGSIPLGSARMFAPVFVPSPRLFAETVLREALREAGVKVLNPVSAASPSFASYRSFYKPENQVTEHVSPPLSEEIKVTLKVSQNLHAFMGPFLLGTLVAKDEKDPFKAGFGVERKFLLDAKLSLAAASQGDGAGGSWADLFSPDFMCHYLAYWSKRPDYPIFLAALPILGKDGTLEHIQPASPAAGHVFAKTGTFDSRDMLNDMVMMNGKGLAGYVIRADGVRLTFAAYVNHVHMQQDSEAAAHALAEALGEIAAAAYDAPLDSSSAVRREEIQKLQ